MQGLLDGMSSRQLAEWMAYDRIVEADRTRAELAMKAEADLQAMKHRS